MTKKLKILVVIESGSWANHHLAGSLEDMGHEVTRFFYGDAIGEFYPKSRSQERQKKNNALLELARQMLRDAGLDLIFCYVYDDFLSLECARCLARLDVQLVNFNVDMVNQWYRQIRTAKYFSRILCAQKIHMKDMSRYGARTMYFPMAGRFPLNHAVARQECAPAAPVTFVGTPMPYRIRVLQQLIKQKTPLAVYGKFWRENRVATPARSWEKTLSDAFWYARPRLQAEGAGSLAKAIMDRMPRRRETRTEAENAGSNEQISSEVLRGFVPEEALSSLFQNSTINLGFTRMIGDDPNREGVNQVKLRDFEVPMAGGFYLVERAPDYGELFEIGKEVEDWATLGELQEKIKYYLEHPLERSRIAQAGCERARNCHTWQQRFQVLFAELGIT